MIDRFINSIDIGNSKQEAKPDKIVRFDDVKAILDKYPHERTDEEIGDMELYFSKQ